MKKTLLFTFMAVIANSSLIFGQLDFKIGLQNYAWKRPTLSIEAGADKFSVELVNSFNFKRWGVTLSDDQGNETDIGVKRFSYQGTVRANYYFNPPTSLDGWYASPYTSYKTQSIKFETPKVNNRFGAGLIIGRKGLIDDHFGYQAEAGFGYWFVNKYKNKLTGEPAEILEDGGLFSSIISKYDKFSIPIYCSVFYRIGE